MADWDGCPTRRTATKPWLEGQHGTGCFCEGKPVSVACLEMDHRLCRNGSACACPCHIVADRTVEGPADDEKGNGGAD